MDGVKAAAARTAGAKSASMKTATAASAKSAAVETASATMKSTAATMKAAAPMTSTTVASAAATASGIGAIREQRNRCRDCEDRGKRQHGVFAAGNPRHLSSPF
jgi:hypothetical protein